MSNYNLDELESLMYSKSSNTRRAYLKKIKNYLDWCQNNTKQITQFSVIEFVTTTFTSSSSKNQAFSALRKYLSYKNLPYDKISDVPTATTPREHLTEKEALELLCVRKNNGNDIRNNLMMRLIIYGGLRRSEVVNLKLEDINIINKSIRIHGEHVKRNHTRLVYIDEGTLQILAMYLKIKKIKKSDDLFPIDSNQLYNVVVEYMKETGIDKKISPHRLRHTFAITYINRGGQLSKLKKLLGHSNITTTSIYLDYSDKELEDEYRKIYS